MPAASASLAAAAAAAASSSENVLFCKSYGDQSIVWLSLNLFGRMALACVGRHGSRMSTRQSCSKEEWDVEMAWLLLAWLSSILDPMAGTGAAGI